MFSKRGDGDFSPKRFWRWFAREARGIANAIEALSRGEADAEWALIGLNERIRRYDASLEADVIRTLDGRCQMIVSGGSDDSVMALLEAAPTLPGWTFATQIESQPTRRVPFRLAPRPSLDNIDAPIGALAL
ncbi:MAG TPA: hypothetical protein VFV70_14035 [Hyphomonadaceae bacterium]|nr:hypothetical protein [Hyphomonadaceae bacterium]